MAEQNGSSDAPPAQASAAKRRILVINHTDQVYRIPIMDPGRGKDRRPSVEATVVLLPGANAVDPDAMEVIAEYPIVKVLMQKKHRGGFEVGDPDVDVRTLSSFKDIDEAKEIVDATVDLDLLKSWMRTERREEILKAIEAQLEKIDPRRDPATEDEKATFGEGQ